MSIDTRLKVAREKLGLTLRQVEERTGIGQSSISEYESGKRAPRISQLQALAKLYRRPISFFLEEGDIPHEMVLWRQKPEAEVAADVQAQFLLLCEQYHNLEVWCDERVPCSLPVAQGRVDTFGYDDAERLAHRVRSELQLGDRPGQGLLRVLEEACGVKVFHLQFEPKGAAACTVSESTGIGILLNSKNVRWRRNFDLAHELFHVLTWAIFQSGQSADAAVASPPEESFANVFASRLLMPTDALRLAIGSAGKDRSLTPAALFDVARQFDVSVEALLWRLKSVIRDLDEDKIRRMIEVCQSKASILEERERDDPPMRPARFVALAMKAFSRGEISKGVLAEYLGLSRQEVMRLVERESPLDEEITLPPA